MELPWEKRTAKRSAWQWLGEGLLVLLYFSPGLIMAYEDSPWSRSQPTPWDLALERQRKTEEWRATRRLTTREKALKELLFYRPGTMASVRIGSITYSRDPNGDIWMENVKTKERKKMQVWDSM